MGTIFNMERERNPAEIGTLETIPRPPLVTVQWLLYYILLTVFSNEKPDYALLPCSTTSDTHRSFMLREKKKFYNLCALMNFLHF